MSEIKQRLLEFIESEGLNPKSFEIKADLSNGFVGKVGSYVRDKSLEKIRNTFPRLNISWLISGAGAMLNNSPLKKTNENQIPMYNLPAAAGEVEVYSNPDDVKIVGYMNLPGAHKDSVALPAYGHSMYPTIANGDWAVSRTINDPTEIVWGEVYYIEWSDYKMYKRLLKCEDNADEVILWSDNQLDKIGNHPKYAALNIKKESIRRLRLVTEILKKPNY